MVERIDLANLTDDAPTIAPTTAEGEGTELFTTGPAEFICKVCAQQLLADPQWCAFFGENIDPYMRMDYPQRAFPALRIYSQAFDKQYESWFINGDLTMDIIFPASIRRIETEQIPDTVSAALLQQFRRPSFFNAVSAQVPALNELGKRFAVDKSLAFELDEGNLVPLTRVSVNFKIDLRIWDSYLESDYRTKDEPYKRTLADLRTIIGTIEGVDDDGNVDVTLPES